MSKSVNTKRLSKLVYIDNKTKITHGGLGQRIATWSGGESSSNLMSGVQIIHHMITDYYNVSKNTVQYFLKMFKGWERRRG